MFWDVLFPSLHTEEKKMDRENLINKKFAALPKKGITIEENYAGRFTVKMPAYHGNKKPEIPTTAFTAQHRTLLDAKLAIIHHFESIEARKIKRVYTQ